MKKTFIILTTLILSLSFFSCATIKEIPQDKSAIQILQMGQNAAATGSFSSAELCFNTVIERFGDDPNYFTQATYELGHIFRKQKKYDKAIKEYNKILDLYDLLPGAVHPKFKKLCEMEIEIIENATAPKKDKAN